MGFRNPITSVAAVDTRPGATAPGVRMYEAGDVNARWGVLEFDDPAADAPATLTARLNAGSGGSVQGSLLALRGITTNGKAAPELDLTIESAPTSGYWRVARVLADFLALPGDTADALVPYVAGVTSYTDSTGWNGLRCWKRSGVVTISGAFRATVNIGANGILANLPAGFAPPEKVQTNIDGSTAVTVVVMPNGQLQLGQAQAAGFVASVALTYAVLS